MPVVEVAVLVGLVGPMGPIVDQAWVEAPQAAEEVWPLTWPLPGVLSPVFVFDANHVPLHLQAGSIVVDGSPERPIDLPRIQMMRCGFGETPMTGSSYPRGVPTSLQRQGQE